MAVVIPFQPRPRPRAATAEAAAPREATILFFTGVRYERMQEPSEPQARPPRRSAGRGTRSRHPT